MSSEVVSVLVALHTVAAAIWVGGMFFAYMMLRPVPVAQLRPPERLQVWLGCFQHFFPWVWLSIGLLLLTGFWLMFGVFGGMAGSGIHIHLIPGLTVIAIGSGGRFC